MDNEKEISDLLLNIMGASLITIYIFDIDLIRLRSRLRGLLDLD